MPQPFFSKHRSVKFELLLNENLNSIGNADEIMDAIKHYRFEINEKLNELDELPPADDVDREIASLIRQDQYLSFLEGKQKCELAEMFLITTKNNCIAPDILNWYQSD